MTTCAWLIPAACFLLGDGGTHPAGYLVDKTGAQEKLVPYAPREADLIFYDDHSKVWTPLFAMAGTGPPLHMGIVVKKSDGTFDILEAGPDDTLWVALQHLAPRLHQFERDFHGEILIRRCKKTLTKEQSAALTRFAEAQKGKRYAALRLLMQGTPLRARGALESYLGGTDLKRDSWICSELAVAAATVVGLMDSKEVPANATYPKDLVDNQRYRLGGNYEDAAAWRPRGQRKVESD